MWNNEYTYKKGYNGTLEERMANKTSKSGIDGCWLWTAACDTAGYATIRVDKKLRRASHVAFEMHNNVRVTEGMVIMHSCDNPACVNPHHLSIGTKALNNLDKKDKGRCNPRRGDNHPMHKLTTKDIDEIRSIFNQGNHTFTSIASIYNVNRSTIARIVYRKNWI